MYEFIYLLLLPSHVPFQVVLLLAQLGGHFI